MPAEAAAAGCAAALAAPGAVGVVAANVYLAREVCDACFPDVEAVALLLRDERVHVVPLIRDSAGGVLLKIRNARGDRVLHAQEFFRTHGLAEDRDPQQIAARWSAEVAALVLDDVRKAPAR